MHTKPQLLDVVALLADVAAQGLLRGQVGTVVEFLDGGAYEVEFSDDEGKTYAELALAPPRHHADQALAAGRQFQGHHAAVPRVAAPGHMTRRDQPVSQPGHRGRIQAECPGHPR